MKPPASSTVVESPRPRHSRRIKRFTFDKVAEYFGLPLKKAAGVFSMCPTVFKKQLRRLGIKRWPHRKVRGLLKQLAEVEASKASTSDQSKRVVLEELRLLHTENYYIEAGEPCNHSTPQQHFLAKTSESSTSTAVKAITVPSAHLQAHSVLTQRLAAAVSNRPISQDEIEVASTLSMLVCES